MTPVPVEIRGGLEEAVRGHVAGFVRRYAFEVEVSGGDSEAPNDDGEGENGGSSPA